MAMLAGYSVLVVEDDANLRELLVDDFRLEGAEVQDAENGQQAIELIKKNVFDVVLSDIRMPNGDGRFLAEQILSLKHGRSKNEKFNLPALFMYSGYNEISPEEQTQLGIIRIFAKPIDVTIIFDSIREEMKLRIAN